MCCHGQFRAAERSGGYKSRAVRGRHLGQGDCQGAETQRARGEVDRTRPESRVQRSTAVCNSIPPMGILFLLLGSMAMSVVVYSCSRSPLCCPDFTPYSHWPHRASAALPRPALPLVSPPATALAGGPQGPTRHHCLAPTSVGLDTLWPHKYSHHSPYLIMGMPRRGLVGRAPRPP